MTELTPFHIAFPVRDIPEARQFYGGLMALPEGRSADTWIANPSIVMGAGRSVGQRFS